jgi:LacI family transcriptional regulator
MANANIKLIAEKTNLSPGTVSIVLNGRGDKMRISEKLKPGMGKSKIIRL